MNNRTFVLGSFLMIGYCLISFATAFYLIFMDDFPIVIIGHFIFTVMLLCFYVYWLKVYKMERLDEIAVARSVYKWTNGFMVITLVLYAIIYLLFIVMLFLFSGPPADF